VALNDIRTSGASISVPWEKFDELRKRLHDSGANEAADDLGPHRGLVDSRKPQVIAVLDAWADELGEETLGPELLELRRELRNDVS
jgi:hypothetical protein